MSAGPLVVEIICTCCLAAFLLHRYGDLRKQHAVTTLATFVAWYFSFLIVFVLPLDVSSTFYRQCLQDYQPKPSPTVPTNDTNQTTTPGHNGSNNVENTTPCVKPISHVPDNVLPALWHVVYWSSQFLTWLLLPLMQSYSTAGDFTVSGKIKTALIENAIYYGTYLLIFGICLIYVAVRPDLHIDGEKLKIIGITASNTWGLFLLVLLLGYGLVEVPRTVWNSSKHGYMLGRTQFKISKLSTEKTEAEENLEDVLEEIKQVSEKVKYNHPLRKHVDTVLSKCPESVRKSVKPNVDDYEDYNAPQDVISEKALVRLHKRVIQASQTYRRTQIQWRNLIEKAFSLEDEELNRNSPERRFKRSIMADKGWWRSIYTPTVEWYWKCLVRAWVFRVATVVLGIFSFMVVWSECLFFIKSPVLSLFAVFLNAAKHNYDYVYIELASIITIAYLCFCAYYSVFQIKILNFYYIAPHHQTDEYSLVFTGMMLCRLTPPLCLNFLGLIHLDSHIINEDSLQETSYTQIMGHMDVISIVSDGFNIYFPIAIVLLCICTYFSLGSRILHFLGFQQFIGDDDMTQEFVDEGKNIISRERRKLERKANSDERKREWTEKFGVDWSSGSSSRNSRKEVETANDFQMNKAKQSVARSPDDNDKTGLLREAEPMEYTGELVEEYNTDRISGQGYQSGRTNSSRYGSRPRPPKGIFDDV